MMKRGKNLTVWLSVAILTFALSGAGYADVVHVYSDGSGLCPTIQAGIDAVDAGGTVILEPGTYTGDGNRDISFAGKAVTVQSTDPSDPSIVAATVIDLQGTSDDPHYGFIFDSGEDANSVLDGVTITNSIVTNPASSGIYCGQGSAVIRNCIICDMHSYSTKKGYYEKGSAVEVVGGDITLENCTLTRNVGSGDPDTSPWPSTGMKRFTCGGVDIYAGSVTLLDCTLSDNYSWYAGAVVNWGGAVVLTDCQIVHNSGHECGGLSSLGTAVLTNCLFAGNTSAVDGGALVNHQELVAINCTFAGNDAAGAGDALYNANDQIITDLVNCILWNVDDEIASVDGAVSSVSYCCVRGGFAGEGNFDADPCFIDPASDDYRLMMHSPCIDTGLGDVASDTDILGHRRWNSIFVDNIGTGSPDCVDIGAYEFRIPPYLHRFWSPLLSRHFYTASEAEKDYITATYASNVWTYEGPAFRVFDAPVDRNVLPVHRFWSPTLGTHFYTIDEDEKEYIVSTYAANIWTYEGVAFYACAPGDWPQGTVAVHRFWSDSLGSHFYTTDEDERDGLIDEHSDVWTYEGVAWYACYNVMQWPSIL
jgi:hypothetical protein